MAGTFTVVLESYPSARREQIERVVRKHNRRLDHHAFVEICNAVAAGGARPIARYGEEHAAHNVVAEVAYHGGRARIEAADAA